MTEPLWFPNDVVTLAIFSDRVECRVEDPPSKRNIHVWVIGQDLTFFLTDLLERQNGQQVIRNLKAGVYAARMKEELTWIEYRDNKDN